MLKFIAILLTSVVLSVLSDNVMDYVDLVEIRKNVCPNEINSCFGDVLLNPIALQKGVLCFATTFEPTADVNGPIFFVVTAGGHSFIKGNALLLLSMIHFAT